MSHSIIIECEKDKRYANYTVHELKMMRKNMTEQGKYTQYEYALVQYYIMKKENRLDHLMGVV